MSTVDLGIDELDDYERRRLAVDVRAFRDRWAAGRPVLVAFAEQLLEAIGTGGQVAMAWDPDATPANTRTDRRVLVEFARRRRDEASSSQRVRDMWNGLLIAIDDEQLDVIDDVRRIGRWYVDDDPPQDRGSWGPMD